MRTLNQIELRVQLLSGSILNPRMNGPTFRALLGQDRPLIGTIVGIPSLENVEILSRVGFDWLFVDLEHSAISTGFAQNILQVAGNRVHVVARLANGSELEIKRALDIGCDGVIVPFVNTRGDAEQAVRFSKYPPMGTRSVGVARAHGYGPGFKEYVDSANETTALIVQIEHRDGVSNLEEILEVKGIDAVLIGPYDLSASMNLMGQVSHPDVQAAIGRIREACKDRRIPYGLFGVTSDACQSELEQGAGFVIVGVDSIHLHNGAAASLRPLADWVSTHGQTYRAQRNK